MLKNPAANDAMKSNDRFEDTHYRGGDVGMLKVENKPATLANLVKSTNRFGHQKNQAQNSQHIAPQHYTGHPDNKSRFDDNSRFKPSVSNSFQIESTADGDDASSRLGGDVGMFKNSAANDAMKSNDRFEHQKNPPQPLRPRYGGSISGPNPASKAHPVAFRLDAKPLNQFQVRPRDSSILKQPTRPMMSRFDKNVGSSAKIPETVNKRLGEHYPNATSFIETPPSNSKAINFKQIDLNTSQSANSRFDSSKLNGQAVDTQRFNVPISNTSGNFRSQSKHVLDPIDLTNPHLNASHAFFTKFEMQYPAIRLPIGNRLSQVYKGKMEELETTVESAHITMHKDTLDMIYKYCKANELNVELYIAHLVKDRPLSCDSKGDAQLPRISSEDSNNLSSSEILFASLLQVSSVSRFINDCRRNNHGKKDLQSKHLTSGYLSTVVGPRFDIRDKMDSLFMVVHENSKNTFHHGSIEKLLHDYYFKDELLWLSHDQILHLPKDQREMRYLNTPAGFFDKFVYSKRLRLSMIPYLIDVNETAKKAGGKATVKISGWGLEKSKATLELRNLFVIELFSVLTALEKAGLISELNNLTLVKVENTVCLNMKKVFFLMQKRYGKMTIQVQQDQENSKPMEHDGSSSTIKFFSLCSDANSYPGNEYWTGNLSTSENASITACSAISEIQNPLINGRLLQNIMIYPKDTKKLNMFLADQSDKDLMENLGSRAFSGHMADEANFLPREGTPAAIALKAKKGTLKNLQNFTKILKNNTQIIVCQ